MTEETNKKKRTKEELTVVLNEEIAVLKLELVHSKLIADIQEQSTRRSSLIVQEANIIGTKSQKESSDPIKPDTDNNIEELEKFNKSE
jgi:hypothetical protein